MVLGSFVGVDQEVGVVLTVSLDLGQLVAMGQEESGEVEVASFDHEDLLFSYTQWFVIVPRSPTEGPETAVRAELALAE